MFDRLTDEARNIVVAAQEEARALRHTFVGGEHLLLGLMRQPPDSVLTGVIGALGVSADGLRRCLLELVPAGEGAISGPIPFTPRAKWALVIALREAHGRGDRHIGAEHILLALTRDDADSTALRILSERNLTPEVVRSAVDAALPAPEPGHDADDPPPQSATG